MTKTEPFEDLDSALEAEIGRILKIEWQSPRCAFMAGMIVGHAKRLMETDLTVADRWKLLSNLQGVPAA